MEEKGVHKFIEHDIALIDHDYGWLCRRGIYAYTYHVSSTCHVIHCSGDMHPIYTHPRESMTQYATYNCWIVVWEPHDNFMLEHLQLR